MREGEEKEGERKETKAYMYTRKHTEMKAGMMMMMGKQWGRAVFGRN